MMINLTREEAEQVIKLLDTLDPFNAFTNVREPLRAKLSEPEPEPELEVKFEQVANGIEVGYDFFGGVDIRLGGEFVYVHINYDHRYTHNAARTQLADKIVGLLTGNTAPPQRKECLRCGEVNPAEIHTCTPQREWVGLTDEECTFLACKSSNGPHCVAMTEAKLKEKNA